MSKYSQKPYTAEEKKKAIEQYCEKIQYSPRYSSESPLVVMNRVKLQHRADLQTRIGNTGEPKRERFVILANDRHVIVCPSTPLPLLYLPIRRSLNSSFVSFHKAFARKMCGEDSVSDNHRGKPFLMPPAIKLIR